MTHVWLLIWFSYTAVTCQLYNGIESDVAAAAESDVDGDGGSIVDGWRMEEEKNDYIWKKGENI